MVMSEGFNRIGADLGQSRQKKISEDYWRMTSGFVQHDGTFCDVLAILSMFISQGVGAESWHRLNEPCFQSSVSDL